MVPEHDAAVSTGRDECRRMGGVKAYVVDAVDIVDAVGRCTVAAEFEVVSAVLATRQLGIALKETKEKQRKKKKKTKINHKESLTTHVSSVCFTVFTATLPSTLPAAQIPPPGATPTARI